MITFRYILSTLLWSSVSVVAVGRRPRWEPLPGCDGCVSRRDILAPGVGFDLTFSYATAAIRYDDGSLEDLVKVEAGNDFQHLMIRMQEPPSVPHCWNFGRGELRCRLQYAKRGWNKFLGRPATPDVGTIAKLLKALRLVAEEKLGSGSLQRAQLSIPFVPGLSHDDWRDAMEHVRLGLLSSRRIADEFQEAEAAFAGSGYGLCKHYDDLDACEDEEADLPISHVLAVSLSRAAFQAVCSQMKSAESSHGGRLNKQITRIDLGLNSMYSNSTFEDEALYWSQIRETIVEVGRQSRGKLNTLLLLGEEGHNSAFIQVVQDALRELLPDTDAHEISGLVFSKPADDKLEPLWLAARGTAELAKRYQEAPRGCKESAHCADNRRRGVNVDDQALQHEGEQAPLLEL